MPCRDAGLRFKMRSMNSRCVLAFLATLAAPAWAAELAGRVSSVEAGDALTLVHEGRSLKVRLAEIDAPELRQSHGPQSRESLSALCLGKEAAVTVLRRDAGAVTGKVECDGVAANEAQVERGMAWVVVPRRGGRTASPLSFLEDQAQRARVGLWSEPSPVAPWIYRRSSSRARSTPP